MYYERALKKKTTSHTFIGAHHHSSVVVLGMIGDITFSLVLRWDCWKQGCQAQLHCTLCKQALIVTRWHHVCYFYLDLSNRNSIPFPVSPHPSFPDVFFLYTQVNESEQWLLSLSSHPSIQLSAWLHWEALCMKGESYSFAISLENSYCSVNPFPCI